MSLLGFTRARRIEPDPVPASDPPDLTVQIEVTLPPAFQPNPDRICRGDRQNPTCDEHPWWRHDPHALHLADLTRELGSAWKAARRIAIEANEQKRGGGA